MKTRNIVGFVFVVAALAIAGYSLADEDSDLKMQEAREALNQARYEHAAQLLEEIYHMEQGRQEAGNALYWQAFARYKLQKTHELKIATELLRLQQEQYLDSETAGDGEALLARLYGELAERGEIEGVREIHELSDDEMSREATRVAALEALMRMDPDKALPILEKIVTGEKKVSEDMRRHSIFILCRMDDQRSEDLLIDMLNRTEDPEMLSELVMCLSMKNSESALDAIVDLFKRTDDPEVDEAAMFAIGRHGGDRAFDMLAGIARDPNNDPELRAQALFSLSHTDRTDQVTQIAVSILNEENDRHILEAALFTLSRTGSEAANEALLSLVKHPLMDEEFKSQALFAASRSNQLDIKLLREVYDQANGRELKIQVCHVITRMDDEEAALDALIEIIREEDDPEIRQEAVFWVSRFDNERAAEFLLEVINEE